MAAKDDAQMDGPPSYVGEPRKTPIARPLEGSKPAERKALTADQEAKYDWLLQRARSWTELASTKDKAGPLTDADKLWLTRDCLLRYLRAVKWNQKDAEKRLLSTLTWRRDFGVDELDPDKMAPENETGKQILLGYDNQGRPCHYLNPGRQNTDPSPRQVQHLVFMLERDLDLMPPGQENLNLLINFKSGKSRAGGVPSVGLAREVLHILQNHYPERLGKALIINVPWLVNGFFKLITPFIDPLTREKLKFNEDVKQYVPAEQLWTEFKGYLDFEYDHALYWPALIKLCEERRADRQRRWEAAGKQIGETEDYLTGRLAHGIAGNTAVAPVPVPEEATKPETVAAAPTAEMKTLSVASPRDPGAAPDTTLTSVPEEQSTAPPSAEAVVKREAAADGKAADGKEADQVNEVDPVKETDPVKDTDSIKETDPVKDTDPIKETEVKDTDSVKETEVKETVLVQGADPVKEDNTSNGAETVAREANTEADPVKEAAAVKEDNDSKVADAVATEAGKETETTKKAGDAEA